MRNASREAKYTKRLANAAEWLEAVGEGRGCSSIEGGQVTEIRMRMATGDYADVLLIVKASDGAQKFVAFCGGPDVVTALLIYRKKEMSGALLFREDDWVPG